MYLPVPRQAATQREPPAIWTNVDSQHIQTDSTPMNTLGFFFFFFKCDSLITVPVKCCKQPCAVLCVTFLLFTQTWFSLSWSEPRNSRGSVAKAYFCRWPSAALRHTVPRLRPGTPSGIHSPCWHDIWIQDDTSLFHIDFKEALILIKHSSICHELRADGLSLCSLWAFKPG